MITWIAAASCLLAVLPAILFVRNLSAYALLPRSNGKRSHCSVLIPARNEAENIGPAVDSILTSEEVELEVIVLDDGSDDRTAEIVRDIANRDPRVRLETSAPLPPGWCGKNFACHQLARLSRYPLLVFIDADVRVTRPDALARLAQFVEDSGAALVSGIPRQEMGTFLEKLLIPLIHFVLLGFLSLRRVRASADPRFAAACGQIIAVRRVAYEMAGGHAAIAGRIHDAVALARSFKSHRLTIDLFDATDTFKCRMYHSATEVWRGLAKNAHEGLAAPRLIGPVTVLLLGGQLLPLCLLATSTSSPALILALIGTVAGFLPRALAAGRFRQPLFEALLHPIAVCVLLAIQWSAFFCSLRQRPAVWKGRSYFPGVPAAAKPSHATSSQVPRHYEAT